MQVITKCPKCSHELCLGCGLILLEVQKPKEKETVCFQTGIECCGCKEKIEIVPIFYWKNKWRNDKAPVIFHNEATSEGEKEK